MPCMPVGTIMGIYILLKVKQFMRRYLEIIWTKNGSFLRVENLLLEKFKGTVLLHVCL